MSIFFEPVAEFYRAVLNPMQPFSNIAGAPITLLDIAACFRPKVLHNPGREEYIMWMVSRREALEQ